MPELPDVAGFKQYLDATSLHQPIARTSVRAKDLLAGVSPRKLSAVMKGHALNATTRHGKFLFAKIDKNGWLVLHFGMTGELTYFEEPADEPQYAAVTWRFENGRHLSYISRRKLGRVGLTNDLDAFIAGESLGPDALSDEFDADRFVAALDGRTGLLKAALMNQSIMAGIGNVWADEILFQAGVHPEVSVNDLDKKELPDVYRVMRRVLRVGAEKGGTLEKLPRGYFLPHREGDGECPKCGGDIQTITVSGRTTHFCPKCQKKP